MPQKQMTKTCFETGFGDDRLNLRRDVVEGLSLSGNAENFLVVGHRLNQGLFRMVDRLNDRLNQGLTVRHIENDPLKGLIPQIQR